MPAKVGLSKDAPIFVPSWSETRCKCRGCSEQVLGIPAECEKTYAGPAKSALVIALDLGKSRDDGYEDQCRKKMRLDASEGEPPPRPVHSRDGRVRSELPINCVKIRGEAKRLRKAHRLSCHDPHCISECREIEAEENCKRRRVVPPSQAPAATAEGTIAAAPGDTVTLRWQRSYEHTSPGTLPCAPKWKAVRNRWRRMDTLDWFVDGVPEECMIVNMAAHDHIGDGIGAAGNVPVFRDPVPLETASPPHRDSVGSLTEVPATKKQRLSHFDDAERSG